MSWKRMPDLLKTTNSLPIWKKSLQAAASALMIVLLWQLTAAGALLLRGVEFPGPADTLQRIIELTGGRELSGHPIATHIRSSLQRWIGGLLVASTAGIAWGVAAGRSPLFESLTSRIPQLLLLIPGLAWIPVALLLFGIGEQSTMFMITISAFAPIAVNVQSGIKHVDTSLVRAARMMGAGPATLFFSVLLPAALPSIISGLRIGTGTGWRVLVAAEMIVGTGTGLGYSIIQARWTLDYASSFACIAIICMVGLLVEQVMFRQLERRTLERWSLKTREER
ncbi:MULTISPECIES: ABC transporter permease [Prosthecochloris]|nr:MULTISPECIES: ABC transporter permease [Prosthecochloris]